MGRLFQAAISAAGHEVDLVSNFRSWDGSGDEMRQCRLREIGLKIARRLVRTYMSTGCQPELWFTYHVYHKAPDWIGPYVCDALQIPYVVAEASFAPRQSNGPWRTGHEQCRLGLLAASAVISLNRQDDLCLRGLLSPFCELFELKPFMSLDGVSAAVADRAMVAGKWGVPLAGPWLVCVAMMRAGDKLESFTQLARALDSLADEHWHLIIVGDGACRARVVQMFEPFGSRVTITGLLDRDAIYTILNSSDVYVWPAVNEAYGMALLEAQACGLPVVAAASGGVPQIVEHGRTGLLSEQNDVKMLSRHIRELLRNPMASRKMGSRAETKCRGQHDVLQIGRKLDNLFDRLRHGE